MNTYTKRFFRNFDFPLFFVFLVTLSVWLVMIYSSSMVWAVSNYDFRTRSFFIITISKSNNCHFLLFFWRLFFRIKIINEKS